jgi:hypothetical protein
VRQAGRERVGGHRAASTKPFGFMSSCQARARRALRPD